MEHQQEGPLAGHWDLVLMGVPPLSEVGAVIAPVVQAEVEVVTAEEVVEEGAASAD